MIDDDSAPLVGRRADLLMDDVADLAEVAIGDRLARAGITAEQAAELVALDPRIVYDAPTATSASIVRLKRWLDEGMPSVDLRRLVFHGHDEVRAVIVEALARVPAPARFHAIEFTEWLSVGRGAMGWCGRVRTARAPAGDSPHRVLLCGAMSDADILDAVPHELAHLVHMGVCPLEESRPTTPAGERDARALLFARDLGIAKPEIMIAMIADQRADGEYLAEATARDWGFERRPLHCEARRRRQKFIAELNAAAELVPSLEQARRVR